MWRFFVLALALRAGAAQDTCPTYAMIDMASWQPPSASEVMADVDVTHCTKLRFKYTTAYDVWLMGSKDAYDKCCFSECGSTQVGSGAQGGTLSEDDDAAFEYEVLADDAGMTLYFSDSKGTHCQDGQKVTVNVLEALVWNRTIGSENPEGGLAVASLDQSNAFSSVQVPEWLSYFQCCPALRASVVWHLLPESYRKVLTPQGWVS